MGNIILQSQPYALSVTFNVFHQMTISPKVSVIRIQSKSLYIGLLDPKKLIEVLIETVGVDLICKFYRFRPINSYNFDIVKGLDTGSRLN